MSIKYWRPHDRVVREVMDLLGFDEKQARKAVTAVHKTLAKALGDKKEIRIPGFGRLKPIFYKGFTYPRTACFPGSPTGPVIVPDQYLVGFKPSLYLKKLINSPETPFTPEMTKKPRRFKQRVKGLFEWKALQRKRKMR